MSDLQNKWDQFISEFDRDLSFVITGICCLLKERCFNIDFFIFQIEYLKHLNDQQFIKFLYSLLQ